MNLAVRMKVNGINQLWVANIIYIRLSAEFVYLAVVLDAWSRKVVGWALERTLAATLTVAALEQAIAQRQPPPGLVHHSDRGLQYVSQEYVQVLVQYQIAPSMSRPANPYDNAFCESFIRTIKREQIDARPYRDLDDLCAHVEEFIERYYKRIRLHSALGYRPPEEFEQMAALTEHNLAGGCGAASMSFSRHGEIYRWDRKHDQIGIGGAVPRSPLPHHPACGSAPGGSRSWGQQRRGTPIRSAHCVSSTAWRSFPLLRHQRRVLAAIWAATSGEAPLRSSSR